MASGKTERADYEYIRMGTCSIFIFTEPLAGWRCARAFPQRTKKDWAYRIQWLLNERYPNAEKIVLVMDNLNTHTISSLYETFPAGEAFRLAQRLEIHYTPKHGSRLNIAEIELSAMSVQRLGQRHIPDLFLLNMELAVRHVQRNFKQKGAGWQFKTTDARLSLKDFILLLCKYFAFTDY
jgi:hypothetical protein